MWSTLYLVVLFGEVSCTFLNPWGPPQPVAARQTPHFDPREILRGIRESVLEKQQVYVSVAYIIFIQ